MRPGEDLRIGGPAGGSRLSAPRAAFAFGARLTGSFAVSVAAVVVGIGWLYVLRGLGWPTAGPRLGDSLPLMQLAGGDGQPLTRLLLAWLPTGMIAGAVLIRTPRTWRALIVGILGLALLLLASQVSYALARNVRLGDVIWTRSPGAGAWLEGLMLAVGAALPGRLRGDLLLRAGQRGYAA